MKKRLLFTLSLLAVLGASAQNEYAFSQRTSNYVEMTGATVVSPSTWGEFTTGVALPFTFKYFDEDVDSIFITEGGIFFDADGDDFLSPHSELAQGRGDGQSPVTYRIDGTGTNRILKVQWPNITFTTNAVAYPNDFVNYQVWFYETSHVIEFHYGSSFVTEEALPTLTLVASMMSIDGNHSISVGGDPSAAVPSYEFATFDALDRNPSVNTIFVFTPGFPNSVKAAMGQVSLNIYPNPAGANLTISSNAVLQHVGVLTMSGQQVYSFPVTTGTEAQVNTAALPSGIYFLEIVTAEGVVTRKFAK